MQHHLQALLCYLTLHATCCALASAATPQRDAVGDATNSQDAAVAAALTDGAAWLLANQRPDGSWAIAPDPAGHNHRDHDDLCVTAMAIRALLPGLRDEKLPLAGAIRRADAYVQGQQDARTGRFGAGDRLTSMYAHANALLAIAEVQREWPEQGRQQAIQNGVRYALASRNPFKGWRYEPRSGDNDTKITSMMLRALLAARDVGATVDPKAVQQAVDYLIDMTDPTTGRTGFTRRGEPMSRFTSKMAQFPPRFSEEPTALALLVRLQRGDDPAADATMQKSIQLIADLPPHWDEAQGSIDLAYWEFGAHVMGLVGGEQRSAWRQKLLDALLPHRVAAERGAFWPAVDAWSHPGMEVYSTASAMLALRALRGAG